MTFLFSSNVFFRSLALLCALSFMTMTASAQSQGDDRRGGHKPGPEHLIEVLQVTADQQESFLAIMEAQHQKRMSLHEQYRGNREEGRASMESLHEETLLLLQDVLTADQLATFTEMKNQKQERRPRH